MAYAASFKAFDSSELRALGRPAFWRHRSLASALAQLQIVFAGGCVLPYYTLTPEIPLPRNSILGIFVWAYSTLFSTPGSPWFVLV